jgi:quercetin dioxygenase-like cupin family protein
MTVKHIDMVPAEDVVAGKGTRLQILIGPDESPNFALRRLAIEVGGGMPRHTNTIEHEQYVLSGQGRIGIGDEIHEVKAGHVILIPAGTPHWYQNIGAEPFVFLCAVPNLPDSVSILGDE